MKQGCKGTSVDTQPQSSVDATEENLSDMCASHVTGVTQSQTFLLSGHSVTIREKSLCSRWPTQFRHVALWIPFPRNSGLEVLKPCCLVWFRNQRA